MICGSLPPGVPSEFYARLIARAREQNVKTFLDTDGEPLQAGIEAKPTVVSPNHEEAERLLHKAMLTRANYLHAIERIRAMGAESVILSLGSRGAIGAFHGSMVEILPPRVDVLCPIGAGDALAAAFLWSMEENDDHKNALRWGVAAGTASASLPGMKFANLEQTREVYQKVEVREVE
jgi:1-phosphofructokinase family hexose kinase